MLARLNTLGCLSRPSVDHIAVFILAIKSNTRNRNFKWISAVRGVETRTGNIDNRHDLMTFLLVAFIKCWLMI